MRGGGRVVGPGEVPLHSEFNNLQCQTTLTAITGAKDNLRHVRFTPESRHVQCTHACPLRANSGHPDVLFIRRL
jgi:hypothetical protein